MTRWMKRRIERSRARCEKRTTNGRADKAQPQPATTQPNEQAQADRSDS
jgi:hypothetical protein